MGRRRLRRETGLAGVREALRYLGMYINLVELANCRRGVPAAANTFASVVKRALKWRVPSS